MVIALQTKNRAREGRNSHGSVCTTKGTKPSQSWMIQWRRIKIWIQCMLTKKWKNMTSWYNIIPYHIPNNKWTIIMSNPVSGGS